MHTFVDIYIRTGAEPKGAPPGKFDPERLQV
jgi:hypothetical protein